MSGLEQRLYNGEQNFTEDELSELCHEYGDNEQDGSGRWTAYITSIIQVEDKFFQINWEQGLTEYQEDSFGNQPQEVEPYEETIVVTKYKLKNK